MNDQEFPDFPYRVAPQSFVEEMHLIKELFGQSGDRWEYHARHWCFKHESDLTWYLLQLSK